MLKLSKVEADRLFHTFRPDQVAIGQFRASMDIVKIAGARGQGDVVLLMMRSLRDPV